MKRVKEIDIKNCTYFFDHMINIKNLDPNKIKLDKKPYKKKKKLFTTLDTRQSKTLAMQKLIT